MCVCFFVFFFFCFFFVLFVLFLFFLFLFFVVVVVVVVVVVYVSVCVFRFIVILRITNKCRIWQSVPHFFIRALSNLQRRPYNDHSIQV